MLKIKKSFNEKEIKLFEPENKIGIIATINQEGLPHISLITTLMAIKSTKMTFGQFCIGLSKAHVYNNPKTSFTIITPNKKIWRGKSKWTHKKTEGPEYEIYNNMPMFRYNAYFGINTVHYLDLIETTSGLNLPLHKIIPAIFLTKIAKNAAKKNTDRTILNYFAKNLFDNLATLKFISYVGCDGYPTLVPIIQCMASDRTRLVFSQYAYRDELKPIKKGTTVAVYCMNFKMQSVLIRGVFKGYNSFRSINLGVVDIAWVYNSMPPVHRQVYPEIDLKPVVDF